MRYNLRALHIFSCVATHRSLTKAATELGITQSAISHQLRRLSEELGEKLIFNSGRGIDLTENGEQLAQRLSAAFDEIEVSIAQAVGSGRRTIRLTSYAGITTDWLIPRLRDFQSNHPNIDVQLQMVAENIEMSSSIADVFVTWAQHHPGYWSMRLIRERLIAVYSPAEETERSVYDSLPLITCGVELEHFGSDWSEFARVSGWPLEQLPRARWLRCSHYILAVAMARRGLGIALAPDFLVAEDLKDGVLKRLGSQFVDTHRDYYIYLKQSRRNEPALRTLVNWFKEQLNGEKGIDA